MDRNNPKPQQEPGRDVVLVTAGASLFERELTHWLRRATAAEAKLASIRAWAATHHGVCSLAELKALLDAE